ncbi:hypothetical protein N7481_009574 [Penicillium waksmanii]|uniref:uncharacterized protein n=1 Tax=Penicillium waksmanii TaxID=69791 RepID=UPI002549928F|nr:uncharacterized protein N7481_009574 [Penicillium waksmanii]KAJ5975867.1 hypothetical protein N7481_009574 [Penicillium waksmanii]
MSARHQVSKQELPMRTTVPVDDDDYTSSSGSSSDESEDEESDDDDNEMMIDSKPTSTKPETANGTSIPSIPGRPKPQIHRMEGGSDLLSRLSSFLPQMKDANEELEKEIAAGRGDAMVLDSVDDGKDYIEMNLGLGVLKEKRADGQDSSSEDESDNEDPEGSAKTKQDKEKPDVLDMLMGGKKADTEKPSIEEMAE